MFRIAAFLMCALGAVLSGCAGGCGCAERNEAASNGGAGAGASAGTNSLGSRSLGAGFENLLDSVVKIDVWESAAANGQKDLVRSLGSGVIISPDGLVATNAHVVNPSAEKIEVILPSLERVKARFAGWDHWTDLAVVKIDAEEIKRRNLHFKFSRFGDSDKLKSAVEVYAVGTPHGFARTVTRGIISNTKRYFAGELTERGYETGQFNTWLQTDAAINPGNSGGPLSLPDGTVVGINTRTVLESNNLSFAVPSNVAKEVIGRILKEGKVERAYTGIGLLPNGDTDAENARGALVGNVDVGSPAAVAGIFAGDIIVKINGEPIDGRYPEQLPAIMNKIARMKAGESVAFEILRNGEMKSVSVKTETLESRVGREYALEKWGVGLREITKALRREKKITAQSPMMVSSVRRAFPFDIAGVEEGDILLKIGNTPIGSFSDVEKEYEKYEKSPVKTLVQVLKGRTISYHILAPQ